MIRIGIDIGGTFTDFVLLDPEAGRFRLHKYLTTPDDPSRGALAGLSEMLSAEGIALADIGELVHGTTLVTNALIERRGAKLGLLTTAGMRDVLEFGTEQRYDIHDLFLTFPAPLVPRRWRLEIPERLSRDGDILIPLDEAAVRDHAETLLSQGVDAIAVCFLHSYRNPVHERRAGAILRALRPDLTVSLSSDVVAELREYPRFVTTCANAFVQPLMARYLARLEEQLRAGGFAGALRLMHSAGGLLSPETARAFPIRLLESGPAGGGLATAFFGRLAGREDVLSFDMGGTTAKACLIEGGRAEIAPMLEAAREHRFKKGSGLPIKAPVIDMIEIGAGGGSIAGIDEVGLLRVGPRSAGAAPGPACYGAGGTEPTVTDANLVLGYYDPAFFLGGRMRLDVPAAERALVAVGEKLAMSAVATAWGIHRVVTENMAGAARVHIVEKGRDPRRYAMVAFGGAGPAHAAGVARILGVSEVIVPPASGAASALGFLAAPLSFEQSASLPAVLRPGFDAAPINTVLGELDARVRQPLLDAGIAPGALRIERLAEMRLVGQMHEILVALPDGALGDASLPAIRAAFAAEYTARFTTLYENAEIEAISFRVRCTGPDPALSIGRPAGTGIARKGSRRAWFGDEFVDAGVFDRYALREGDVIAGPAMVEEREATTVIPPGDVARVDEIGNLRIAIAQPERATATITADTPLNEAMRRIEADPVTLEIMWSRLVHVAQEMWSTVVRTAFSLTMCESQDFACDLLDAEGETLAHSPQAMPVFNLSLPRTVKALLKYYPAETLRPGDVLLTNDPWMCTGHLYDFAVVTPVFRGDTLIALTGTIGHVTDIGGARDPLHPRDLYEEGLQIPPLKLYSEGKPNADVLRIIRENVRNADQVLGDLHALIAANARGAERLLAFVEEYALGDLRALSATLQRLAERAMREAIAAFPDGVYESVVYSNPIGEKLRLPLKVTVAGDTLDLDFAGAPPQLPQGGLNVTWNYSAAYATYPLKCIFSPLVRGNSGCYRPFEVRIPEGTLLNCRRPAAVGVRQRNGWYVVTNVQNAIASGAPDRVRAYTGLPFIVTWMAQATDGTIVTDMLFNGGGEGGSHSADGKSGLIWPTSAANTSIEMFEARIPLVVLEKTLMPDTGGAGRHRGGLGARIRVRRLRADAMTMQGAVFPEGAGLQQPGLFGGASGIAAAARLRDAAGAVLQECGSGMVVHLADANAVLDVQVGGGSGFGDPRERPAALIEADLRDGYVTAEGAARDYGWTGG